jgi:hypothetical protein
MKVALILTGYMRNWDFNFQYIKKEILDKYNPDVYISSYTYSKTYWHSDPEEIDITKVIDVLKPKNFLFRDRETCPKFKFKDQGRECIGREYSYRQLYGWYTNFLSLSLFNPQEYDIIIKLRTDIALKNFTIISNAKIVIPAWKIHPGPCEPNVSLIDYFAYGNSKCMKKYFKLYCKMQEMHNNDTGDISLGETLLKDYMSQYIGIDKLVFDYKTDWNLRGEIWETDKVKKLQKIAPHLVYIHNSNH